MAHSVFRAGEPNAGPPTRSRRPARRRTVHYRLRAKVRRVLRDEGAVLARVVGGNAVGRRFLGRELRLELGGARLHVGDRNGDGVRSVLDLREQEIVHAWTRLPADLGRELPRRVVVRRLELDAQPPPA